MQAIAQTLAQKQHIRLDALLLIEVHGTGTAHAALDLVHNEEHSLGFCPVIQSFQIAIRWEYHACCLIAFDDNSGSILCGFVFIFLVQKFQTGEVAIFFAATHRAVCTVWIWCVDHARS